MLVTTPILNINFADNSKSGVAAVGQTANDYWNPYIMPGLSLAIIENLLWSDQSSSPVDLTVGNAPEQWANPLCVDPMYATYVQPSDGGHLIATITELPSGTYDLFVYATRASAAGAPIVEIRKNNVSLWTKGTTIWGSGWYSSFWDEYEQYVRFRGITVSGEALVLDLYPDSAGYASISGIQIVPSAALPPETAPMTKLLNVDFAGYSTPPKSGPAAVGLTASDYWNADRHNGQAAFTMAGLYWSDQTPSTVSLTILNGPGAWGVSLPDPMLHDYFYSGDGGNCTISLSGLPAGTCDIYLYGHTPNPDDNALFELWSDDVNWGIKGTSLVGLGPTYPTWEVGQQYVLFRDVNVSAGKPVVIQAKHTTYGYNNAAGLQIAYTGPADSDVDGLPDGWERRWFGDLRQTAAADLDLDGLTNLREYQLGTDPTRPDSNGNGILDGQDLEFAWVEDATPFGGYEDALNESWSWLGSWYDGIGWGGLEVYPRQGPSGNGQMHVSALVADAMHHHSFDRAVSVIRPASGDVLYAYINLDSTYPPSEVMLQWYVVDENGYGSWEHRAYWGADLIDAGQNGTPSRFHAGPLPSAGQWVRLEVPATALGLEGKIVEGMAFTLWGGRAAWDSAGTINPDHDGDGLLDSWEMQYFANLRHSPATDDDGDGLSNLMEYKLGYDPTSSHTGGTAMSDGDKDFDGDRLSNVAEITFYHSDPANAHTFNEFATDAEYKLTARMDGNTEATLAGPFIVDGRLRFEVQNAPPGDAFDLYIRPDLNPGTRWKRYFSGSPGQTVFVCPIPPGTMNYFIGLAASDHDHDGLTDGFEMCVSGTFPNDRFTDEDFLPDGWEVEYGLNPNEPATADSAQNPHPDGNYGDPDSDEIANIVEYGVSDPKRPNTAQRPIVSATATQSEAIEGGNNATFTFSRTGSLAGELRVYFVLGGTATFGTDYALDVQQNEPYPAYSVKFEAENATALLNVTAAQDLLQEDIETVIVGIAPSPADEYVVATHPHRAVATIRDYLCRSEDSNADFTKGVFAGTEARNNQLHLAVSSHAQFPYVNVACSRRNTVVRIDANSCEPIGEYRTQPEKLYLSGSPLESPSRTTVDQYGNVWVANRRDNYGEMGSMTRIGLIIGTRYAVPGDTVPNPEGFYVKIDTALYNTCIDRDGDGYIKTSPGLGTTKTLPWPNSNREDDAGGVSTAEDEAIMQYVRVPSKGIRSIAVDKFNDVWVGSDGEEANHWACKLDGALEELVPGSPFCAGDCGGYGAAITPPSALSPCGVLWSANYGGSTMRLSLPSDFSTGWPPDLSGICHGIDFEGYSGLGYGITAHPTSGEVWQTLYDGDPEPSRFGLIRWHADGTLYSDGTNLKIYSHGGGNAKGLVIDDNQDIWVAHAEGNTVGRLRYNTQTGDWDAGTAIPLPDYRQNQQPNQPYGVAVDSFGKVWVANFGSHTAMRINPAGNSGAGAVDRTVDLNGDWSDPASPYNYSDLTGFNNHIVNPGGCPLKAWWTKIENGGTPGRIWNVSWIASQPTGTRVEVRARASDVQKELSKQPFVLASSGSDLPVRGQFLELRAILFRESCEQDPYIESLSVCSSSRSLVLLSGPSSLEVEETEEAELKVVALGTEPLTYQWFRNGSPVGANSSNFAIDRADCLDAGEYTVHITDASGEQLDAGPATVTVRPKHVTIPLVGVASSYPLKITVADPDDRPISYVEVSINGLSHDRPDDLDILLVPPNGPPIMLMSDAGGAFPIQDLVIGFSQFGSPPPDEDQLYPYVYATANYGENELSLPPAANPDDNPPAGPYSTNLISLSGINPNGEWKLYIVDDTGEASGSLSGSWCLTLHY